MTLANASRALCLLDSNHNLPPAAMSDPSGVPIPPSPTSVTPTLALPTASNSSQLRAPRSSTDLLSPASPQSPGFLQAASSSPTSSHAHKRQNSIADLIAAPPPLPTSSEYSSKRRASTASNRSSDDGYSGAALGFGANLLPHDWQDVQLNQLVQRENLVFVDGNTSVEGAFETLEKHQFTSLPVRMEPEDPESISTTFDYADLNAYLLLVLGRIEPVDRAAETLKLVADARSAQPVPVKFACQLGVKNSFLSLKSTSTLSDAVEILGNGVHRIAVTDPANPKIVVGVLSQRRLIRFIWENGRLFSSLQPLLQASLQELGIGSKTVISIHGDMLVIDALQQMHDDGVSSLAVTDSANNLLGNISIVDARLVTKSSQKSLLRISCKQFLSIILNKRGLDDGKDSFPVFHVTMQTSLARTIAKLVATKAHRLWIVAAGSGDAAAAAAANRGATAGQLIGVVSLTDILYTLAKHAGKSDLDPHSARRDRRRSSSSSVRSHSSSYDKFRRSISIDRSGR